MNCSQCKTTLTESNSYKKGNKYQSLCRACFNAYCIERWRKRKTKAIQYMGGKCSKCGYDRCEGALEFHHIDPSTKEASWKKMRLWSWNKITAELDKCALLCSNCHRETHCS